MLPQVVIEAMRSGVPIVGAMVGPGLAKGRGRNVSTMKHVAAYSLGGWLAGYVAQRAVFWVLDNLGNRRLPTTVATLNTPAPTADTAMAGVSPTPTEVEVQNDGVQEVDEIDNVVPMKIQSHIDGAYGSEM